jgi:hypothetical protein
MLEKKVNSFHYNILSARSSQSTIIGPQGTVTFIKAFSFGDTNTLQRTDSVFVSSSKHRDSFFYATLNIIEMVQQTN